MKLQISKQEVFKFVLSTLGILLLVLDINLLSWQFKIVSGGMPGYGLALNYLLNIPVGSFLFIVNSIVLILNLIFLGKSSGLKAIYGYILISILFEITRPILGLSQQEISDPLIQLLLITIQGLTAPIGITIVLVLGYSFGSWSSLYPLVNKYFKSLSAPLFFFIMDGILSIIVGITMGWYKGFLLVINATAFYYSFKYLLIFAKKYIPKQLTN